MQSGADEDIKPQCLFFKGQDFFNKVRKEGSTSTSTRLYNLDFFPCPNFLKVMDKKYLELVKRRELAIYLMNWLSEAIFTGGGSKEIRSSYIFVACKMACWECFALAPAMISYLCAELKGVRKIEKIEKIDRTIPKWPVLVNFL